MHAIASAAVAVFALIPPGRQSHGGCASEVLIRRMGLQPRIVDRPPHGEVVEDLEAVARETENPGGCLPWPAVGRFERFANSSSGAPRLRRGMSFSSRQRR
jgi:hypothetical protein